MDAASITGGCACGAVRYRIAGAPLVSVTCQCGSCRRAAAAPIVAWIHVEESDFAITAGAPVAHASSPDVTRTFCGRCGTPLTYRKVGYAAKLDVTTCSLDAPDAFPPIVHVWTSHALGWVALADGLPCLPEGPPED